VAVTTSPATSPAAPQRSTAAAVSAREPRAISLQGSTVVAPQPRAVPTRLRGADAPLRRGRSAGRFGVGAGFSARGWTKSQKIGVQFDVMHSSMTNDVFFTRMSSTQAGRACCMPSATTCPTAPGCVRTSARRARAARVGDDRGTGLATSTPKMAAQFFGGAEMTLAAVPRLGVSADVGYQWYQSPFVATRSTA
jgi:hypothetical protein